MMKALLDKYMSVLLVALLLAGLLPLSLALGPDKAQAVTYPTIYTFTLDEYEPNTDRSDWYDKQLFVASIQGIVNRSGAQLYVTYKPHPVIGKVTKNDANQLTQFWWDKFRQRGQWLSEYNVVNLATLDDLVNQFKGQLSGLVAWDPKVDATVNVATTVAGADNLAMVMYGGALYTKYSAAPYSLAVGRNLNNQFSGANAKTDAYDWAVTNYLAASNKANRGKLAFTEDGFSRHMSTAGAESFTINRDLMVKDKMFVFDLASFSDERPVDAPNQTLGQDVTTLRNILQTAYNTYGVLWPIELNGFTPWWDKYSSEFNKPSLHGAVESEWKMMEEISHYNVSLVNTDFSQSNGSVHAWSPIGSVLKPKQSAPARTALGTNKTYLTFFHGDHDGSTMRALYYLWDNSYRGTGDPVGHGIVPNMVNDYPDVAKYYYETATAKDYFWTGASGAGYTNPGYWSGGKLDIWEQYNDYYYDKAGLTMSGFLLNGNSGNVTTAVELAYSRFGHDGIVGDTVSPNEDVRSGNTSVIHRTTDFDGGNLQQAVNEIVVALNGKNPGSQNNFVVARTAFTTPQYLNLLAAKLKADLPGYHFEIVDPYTMFSLVRQKVNNQAMDSIDLDVQTPDVPLVAGQKYDVSVTARNVGSSTWTDAAAYRMAAQYTGSPNQFIWSDFQDGGSSSTTTNQRANLSGADSIAPQATKTFRFKITAPATAGTYTFSGQMVRDGYAFFGSTFSRTLTVVSTPVNAAQIVSVTAPDYMEEEAVASVSVQVKNIGSATWTAASLYSLASLAFDVHFPKVTPNRFQWNGGTGDPTNQRAALGGDDSILPGQTKTFTFSIKAPKTRGTYTLSTRMVQDGVAFFGPKQEKDIRVVPAGRTAIDAGYVGSTVPKYMKAGTTQHVSVTVKNLGTNTWTRAANDRLAAYSTNQFGFSGFLNGGSSASVTNQRAYLSTSDSIAPEDSTTFEFDITAPATAGTYTLSVDMLRDSVGSANQPISFPIKVSTGDYDSVFSDVRVPATMAAGTIQKVSLDVANAGGNRWSEGEMYRLGAGVSNQFTLLNTGVGGRVLMGPAEVVSTGERKMFEFDIQAPATPGTYTFQVQMLRELVTWFGPTQSVTITVVPAYSKYVNAGGAAFTDSSGLAWSADQAYTSGSWGYTGTTGVTTTANTVSLRSGGYDQAVYKSMRYGSAFGYKFDVTNGTYKVTLLEAEIYHTSDRSRVFNMQLEGKEVWSAFDPWRMMFGKDKGNYISYIVPVVDGQLNIDFTSLTDNAQVNGIVVERVK